MFKLTSLRLIAVLASLCLAGRAQQAPAAEKQLKPGEREIYDSVLKDIGAANPAKAVADLDTWKQQYAESDYKDDRTALYVQAYAASNQPARALDTAGELLTKDIDVAFTGPAGQGTILRLLSSAVWAITQVANPSPGQVAAGDKAARLLMAYDRQLPGVTAEKWAEARADMQAKAAAALLYLAMLPGIQAMAKQPPDCAAAESAYSKALADNPGKSVLSYELGRALSCEAKVEPDKRTPAIYEFVRAAVLDPTLGNPQNDPAKIQAFADKAYVNLHGGSEGLDQLKQLVKQSPLPPAGFKIKTASEVSEQMRQKFEEDNPQLALWMKIQGALADTNGQQYFETQLKDSAVPQLKGVLIEARPACRPKELLIAVPLPDAALPLHAEIMLKLDKALAGKPELNNGIQWEGVPSAFSKEPFLLTMEADAGKIQGLNTTPCTVPTPARRAAKKL